MKSIGFMSLSRESEQSYFEEVAKNAATLDFQCYHFTPLDIDPLTEIVKGYKYNNETNKWLQSNFPMPDLLYDRCFYGDDVQSKQAFAIVNWLKSRGDILFLGYGLPNKLELYHQLSKTILAPYLPTSISVKTGNDVLNQLTTHNPLIIKPTNGSQGHGIYYIDKYEDEFIIKTEKKENRLIQSTLNRKQAIHFLDNLLRQRSYLLQPYLPLSDGEQCPFDIRSLLQKDHHGNWNTIGKGIRKGKENGILSNLSAGAEIISYDQWFDTRSRAYKHYVTTEIEDIYTKLPILLEECFPPLFELGIDIGVAKDGAIWILDINSKPGRKVILGTDASKEELLFKAPLLYATHILNHVKKGMHIHANTLLH